VLERTPGHRALAFDFLGFGLSEKPADHEYTLAWQADLAEELVRRAGGGPVFAVAHDMGTSVATELMARDLRGELGIELSGVLLFNGSILLHRARPTWGQHLLRSRAGPLAARVTSRPFFLRQFSGLFSPDHPLTPEEAEDQWALITHDGGHRIAHRTIAYMDERERHAERWHGAVAAWPGPLSFAWGMLDPVARPAVLAGLRELRPAAPVTELPRLGHYPQIEAPGEVVAALEAALSGSARPSR
jgi:pimeloyl-ACP methyl ester carboxylesterase